MRLALDTNAYTALRRGDPRVVVHVRAAERLYVSSVVVGELLYGFRYGSHFERNRLALDEFLGSDLVITQPVGVGTAEHYGRVAADLGARGRPIPTNDLWIAAHALEAGAGLLTFDAHFSAVDGLCRVDPHAPL